ncbi:MAG: DUF488 domain-containing protein [Opitutales bacterium]
MAEKKNYPDDEELLGDSVLRFSSPVCYAYIFEEEHVLQNQEPSMNSSKKNPLRVKRIYAPPTKNDGIRILVDGIWPRGIKKEEAHLDEWLKELAPTKELRSWFSHDPAKWTEFRVRYHTYLENDESAQAALCCLRERWREGPVTLLFAAKNTEQNNAVALVDFLQKQRR